MRVDSHRLAQGTSCGNPEREGSADKWWKPEYGGTVKVDGRSAPGRGDLGGEAGATIEQSGISGLTIW